MIFKDKPILYVDDTEGQRYAMCRILEREGYRPVEATTGAQALASLHTGLFAIVLDVKLPDMSGYDVCRRIRQNSQYQDIPIIQVSASFADPDHRVLGLSGGADAYIAQPVHPQELLNLVRSLVRSSQAERMLRFMAQIGPRLNQSLDLAETRLAVENAVPPFFADTCIVQLDQDLTEYPVLPSPLQVLAEEVTSSNAVLLRVFPDGGSAIAGPLQVLGKRLGLVLFVLNDDARRYTEADLVYAVDLTDRIALALENSRLYTAQQTAQQALIQSEKLAAAGRLSAAIAHELNNPLEAITNLLYLIDTDPEITGCARNYAREALSELERLSHITRQSLGFYRELTTSQHFNLSDNAQDTLNLYARRLAARNITVTSELDFSLVAFGVPGEIRQVLSNLIVNALDAMADGGTLTLDSFVSPIGEAVIRVRDNGPGVPEKLHALIFEPFFTTKPGTGTGLGLWVSSTIMQKHNGRLELETVSDGDLHGTTMSVILPLATPPQPAP